MSFSIAWVLTGTFPQTGAGTTASRLGQPDLAIAQLADMRDNADMMASLDPFGPPLIADMDTGYGGECHPLLPTPPSRHKSKQRLTRDLPRPHHGC